MVILLLQYLHTKILLYLCIHDILTFQLHGCHADWIPKLNYLRNYCWTSVFLWSLPVLFGLACTAIEMSHRQVFAWGSAPQSSGHSVALPADSGTWFQAGNLCPQSSLEKPNSPSAFWNQQLSETCSLQKQWEHNHIQHLFSVFLSNTMLVWS